MRKLLTMLACLAALPLFAARSAKETTDSDGWLLPSLENWQYRFNVAKSAAAEAKKPMIVVFAGSDWSSASKHFVTSLLKSKTFQEATDGKAIPVLIEYFVNTDAPDAQVEHNAAVRKLLAPPPVYPCTVVVAADGKTILGKIEGDPSAAAFLSQLGELLK